jgi:hypothetical protein
MRPPFRLVDELDETDRVTTSPPGDSAASVRREPLFVDMTTTPETDWMNHPKLRELVGAANALSLAERLTLFKGLVPGLAREMTPKDFEGFIIELRLKGERFYDASKHPGQGRATRHVLGERDVEGR